MEQLQTKAKRNMEKNKYLRIVIIFEEDYLDILVNLVFLVNLVNLVKLVNLATRKEKTRTQKA